MTCAGPPTTVEFSGTSRSTTDPAPMWQLSPTGMLPRIFGPRADYYVIAERWMTLCVLQSRSTQCGTLIEGDVIAHNRGLADHDTHAVTDEKSPFNLCSWMDLHSCQQPRPSCDAACAKRRAWWFQSQWWNL